jgi:two-component system alkaline phosphatase synthesis response regulator PhoP
MGPLIFVVDGVSERRSFVQQILERSGYRVEAFATTRALEIAEQWLPSLMIIAIELPDGNGIVLREKIRQSTALAPTPVLLLADRSGEYRDLIYSSAHEYLIFPLSPGDLLSRLDVVLAPARDTVSHSAADIVIDSAAIKVFVRGREVRTTTLEFRLLEYMARHQGKVFTRDALLDAVWGDLQFVTPRSVDACIRRIRRKIESDSNAPQFLRTIRGIGYKLDGTAAWEATDVCQCRICTAVRTRSKTLASAPLRPAAHALSRVATVH